MTTGGHMFIERHCAIGILVLLSACSVTPSPRAVKVAATTIAPSVAAPAEATTVPPASAAVMVNNNMSVSPTVAPAATPAVPVQTVVPEVDSTPPQVATIAPKARPIKSLSVVNKNVATTVVAKTESKFQVSGQVTLSAASGQQVAAGEQIDTLVYFVPATGGVRAKPGQYSVYTNHRDFSPEAMAVPQGSTVTFVNLDDVRHNVFSVTAGSAFDLGYQAAGDKVAHVFTRAGVVLIGCNVHRSMELDLLVVPSPYYAKVARDGGFTLHGLPAGAGTLHFWNPRAKPASQKVELPLVGTIKQQLLVTKPRMKTELNAGDGS